MKKILVIICCLLILLVLFIGTPLFFSNYDTPKYVQYDMDASDSNHYKLNEEVKFNDVTFKILGYELKESDGLKYFHLNLDIDSLNYSTLQSSYTFMLAVDDNLLKKSNCSYENNSVIVVELEPNKTNNPNQIVIIDNGSFKILATINI